MSISLTQGFRTLDELAKDPRSVVKYVRDSGPIVVTVDGKPDVVIMTVAQYEWDFHKANLARLLAEGEADVTAGRVKSLEDVAKEMGLEEELSGETDSKGPKRRRKKPGLHRAR